MSRSGISPSEERFEQWLDSQAEGGDAQLIDGERFAKDLDVQRQIDDRLRQLFTSRPPSHEQLVLQLRRGVATGQVPASSPQPNRRSWWGVAAVAAAAAMLVAAVGLSLWLSGGRIDEPVFAARPLAEIYRETVASGFEPYYECHEADRFAATFDRRQGMPLALRPLPEGARMLGLSYPGGLSRDTTAILADVQGRPVMVFVDRAEVDQRLAASDVGPKLNVFRDERHGLVFYEVTPLPQAHVAGSLTPLDEGGDQWDESLAGSRL